MQSFYPSEKQTTEANSYSPSDRINVRPSLMDRPNIRCRGDRQR